MPFKGHVEAKPNGPPRLTTESYIKENFIGSPSLSPCPEHIYIDGINCLLLWILSRMDTLTSKSQFSTYPENINFSL